MALINKLRDIILNADQPFVIKDLLTWELLAWDLDKWNSILSDTKLVFRKGQNAFTKCPQFENTTNTVELNFKTFLNYQKDNPNEWLYFDYKYLKEWLELPELNKNIDWSNFGFPELNYEDSTIWIGSKGAHTPCHQDTYGCNLVAQIYGRKEWLLFPPEENLFPTRIPYEESSVYSKINFFAPNIEALKGVKACRIVLNPGDVLFLPHRWWHYVENLELAISINTWIKLQVDHEERIKESIVNLLLPQMVKQLHPDVQNNFLNPSSFKDENEEGIVSSFLIILKCLDNYKAYQQLTDSTLTDAHLEQFFKQPNVSVFEMLSAEEFKLLIEHKGKRFNNTNKDFEHDDMFKNIVDAVVHNDVVDLIKQKLLQNYK